MTEAPGGGGGPFVSSGCSSCYQFPSPFQLLYDECTPPRYENYENCVQRRQKRVLRAQAATGGGRGGVASTASPPPPTRRLNHSRCRQCSSFFQLLRLSLRRWAVILQGHRQFGKVLVEFLSFRAAVSRAPWILSGRVPRPARAACSAVGSARNPSPAPTCPRDPPLVPWAGKHRESARRAQPPPFNEFSSDGNGRVLQKLTYRGWNNVY